MTGAELKYLRMLVDMNLAHQQECRQLLMEVHALKDLLRRIEWVGDGTPYCPLCGHRSLHKREHTPGCELAEAIK